MKKFDYRCLAKQSFDNDILRLCSEIYEHKGRQEILSSQNEVCISRMRETAHMMSVGESCRIDGIVTSDMRLKKLMHDKLKKQNILECEILGYRDTLSFINDNYSDIPLSCKSILELHDRLFRYNFTSSQNRFFKASQNNIGEFVTVRPEETYETLSAACKSFEDTLSENTVEPLVLIFAFVSDFLRIHPFDEGNGRMSRLLTQLLLSKCGFDICRYVSIDGRIEKKKYVYFDALHESDTGWYTDENDYMPFIKFMLEMVLDCYRDFDLCVGSDTDSDKKEKAYDIIKKYVSSKDGEFSVSDVLAACPKVGRTSAFNTLKKLTDEGFVQKFGEKQNVVYLKR